MELREHQKGIVEEIRTRRNVMIVSPMASGKTLATLAAIRSLIDDGTAKSILVVGPKRVAETVWVQEAEAFGIDVYAKYCKNALDVKLHLLDPRSSYHTVVCSVTRISDIPHGCWDAVVMDESTLFKHKQSQRSKEIRRICNRVPIRIELTGTPAHNGYEGLWHQLFLLDGGKSIGKTLTEFRARYCREKYKVNGVVTVYEVDPVKIPQLMDDCRGLVYIVTANVKLPPLLFKDIRVSLPAAKKKEYKNFEETNVYTYKEETGKSPYGDSKSLLAFCRASLGAKLRQFASGRMYVDEGRTSWVATHDEKFKALDEILEVNESPVMVAYQFQSEYEELKKRYGSDARRLESDKDIRDWNEGKIRVALVHPASVGHGLNLQFGGHVLVWFSLTYDGELYAQLNKRLHRPGQKEPVSIVHLITEGTIDERVLKALKQKEGYADTFNKIG